MTSVRIATIKSALASHALDYLRICWEVDAKLWIAILSCFKLPSRPLMICDSYPLGIFQKSPGEDAYDNLLGNIQNTQISFVTSVF